MKNVVGKEANLLKIEGQSIASTGSILTLKGSKEETLINFEDNHITTEEQE
jgi:hypothetical protein